SDGLGPKRYESNESPSWYTMPLASGKKDGHATAGIGWFTRSRGLEKVGGVVVASTSISESTRRSSLSPLANATCLPSGEKTGFWGYVAFWVNEGAAITWPVAVSTSRDASPVFAKTPREMNGGHRFGGMPLTRARLPSGVSAANEKRRPSVDRVRGVTV